jgi:mono/diheme cytochrome c family protein
MADWPCLSISIPDVERQMKMHAISRKFCMGVVGALGVIAALPALSASKVHPQDSQTPAKQSAQKDAGATTLSEGERKFKQNCSRCHEAPQNLSPSVSGTVVRHMRVRASLSLQDERDILKFLNP